MAACGTSTSTSTSTFQPCQSATPLQRGSPPCTARSRLATYKLVRTDGGRPERDVWASSSSGRGSRRAVRAAAVGGSSESSSANSLDNRLLEAALREPVSFWGGIFAGFLALDLQQEPLRSWVQQTAGEAGVKYQVVVERLEAERQARSASSP